MLNPYRYGLRDYDPHQPSVLYILARVRTLTNERGLRAIRRTMSAPSLFF